MSCLRTGQSSIWISANQFPVDSRLKWACDACGRGNIRIKIRNWIYSYSYLELLNCLMQLLGMLMRATLKLRGSFICVQCDVIHQSSSTSNEEHYRDYLWKRFRNTFPRQSTLAFFEIKLKRCLFCSLWLQSLSVVRYIYVHSIISVHSITLSTT